MDHLEVLGFRAHDPRLTRKKRYIYISIILQVDHVLDSWFIHHWSHWDRLRHKFKCDLDSTWNFKIQYNTRRESLKITRCQLKQFQIADVWKNTFLLNCRMQMKKILLSLAQKASFVTHSRPFFLNVNFMPIHWIHSLYLWKFQLEKRNKNLKWYEGMGKSGFKESLEREWNFGPFGIDFFFFF